MTVTGISALGNGFIGLLIVSPGLLFQGDIFSISLSLPINLTKLFASSIGGLLFGLDKKVMYDTSMQLYL